MVSLDPLIERGYGYPLLYQSGETYRGAPLHDRQHPHDLISELSATYSHKLGEHGAAAYLYVGYPGEPALGPPAFVHRASAMDDPDAPISHHWQDATHITWGVVTAGYSLRRWKLEASAFKGGEPDENRTNFDSPRLDSASARLSFNPGANWALQLSHGYLKHPEAAEPLLSRHRTTASVIYNRPLGENGQRGNWATTLVWGRNDDNNGVGTASYLLETNYQSGDNTWYTRLEHVRKAGAELALAAPDDTALFGVNSYAVGYVRELRHHKSMDVGLGAQLTIGSNDNGLDKYYGGGAHRGLQIFLRIRPARLKNG
jgi:hypothetical protein